MTTKSEYCQYLTKTFEEAPAVDKLVWEFIEPLQDEMSSLTYATTIQNLHVVTTLNPQLLTMTCKLISLHYAVVYYNHKKISAFDKEAEICRELNQFKEALQFQLWAP